MLGLTLYESVRKQPHRPMVTVRDALIASDRMSLPKTFTWERTSIGACVTSTVRTVLMISLARPTAAR
jgi:hypothetical protein